ncbi:hypothetical protein EVAR_102083_1 [Eumeta japonica]|uniref:Uncharacterized protein n=1 Tax=Eumeta variegata TaxID=151549 RepID=A0A4C1TZP3_EUMVA|nr:hypothetical protein EVAR_102083_1 [Eumeta japonica]
MWTCAPPLSCFFTYDLDIQCPFLPVLQYKPRNCYSELPANDALRRFNAPRPFLLLRVLILRHCVSFLTNFTTAGFCALHLHTLLQHYDLNINGRPPDSTRPFLYINEIYTYKYPESLVKPWKRPRRCSAPRSTGT